MTRAAWLEARRSPCADGMVPVHASEVDEILFGEPLRVYSQKLGHEEQDSYLLRRGQRMEDAIAEEYAEATGRIVLKPDPFEIRQHPAIPWLRATPDRYTGRVLQREVVGVPAAVGQAGTLELKFAVGSYAEWKAGPPRRHVLQAQAQIACADVEFGALAGMLGPGPLSCHDVEADPELIELALPELEAFRRAVRDRVPPEPRSGAAVPILKRLYGVGSGETISLASDPSVLADALAWEQARADETAAEERKQETLAKLLRRMGGATWADLSDGSQLALRKWGEGVKLERLWPRRKA